MLSLFREQEVSVPEQDTLGIARHLLIQSLNKGIIPEWESFFHDLPTLNRADDLDGIKAYFTKLTEWTFLEPVLSITATEYFFHGKDETQCLTLTGEKITIDVDVAESDWQLWLEVLSIRYHQNWNVQNPFVSFFGELLGRSFRFSLVHASTSPKGRSKLMLRSLPSSPHPLSSFKGSEPLPGLVKEKRNMLIAGSTGSGKTSLLSTLLREVKNDEHVVILEDTYELLFEHAYQTRFLAGSSTETSLKAYLAYSLRLSPDRIILGEMRSHEVVPFLMAMNTGHRGLMGTIHASSGADALHRVALLFSLYSGEASLTFEKVMELLCRNLEYVVFMENKKVKEIIKVLGSEKGVPFFEVVGQTTNFF